VAAFIEYGLAGLTPADVEVYNQTVVHKSTADNCGSPKEEQCQITCALWTPIPLFRSTRPFPTRSSAGTTSLWSVDYWLGAFPEGISSPD
jgi:hypothetical protein